jgi:hypothetical protein
MGCDIHLFVERKNNGQWHGEEMDCWRNYDLFSVLAGVRNYGDNEYIDVPRGLPDDISPEAAEAASRWGDDGHSHSYFTLDELRAWQKEHQTTRHKGLLNPQQAEDLDTKGILPRIWCQWASDKSFVWREWTENYCPLDDLIQRLDNVDRIVFWFDN